MLTDSKPRGYWKSIDNVVAEAQRVMKENNMDTLPSTEVLRELGQSSLGFAIIEYHGGFRRFRQILGERVSTVESGRWKSLEFTIEQAKAVMEKHGFKTLPSSEVLEEVGCSSLWQAITHYHGGFSRFRQLLGEKELKRKNGVWKSSDFTIQQAREVMQKHKLENLPSQAELSRLGYSSLSAAIANYHGGFHEFRKKLGLPAVVERGGVWKDLEFTIEQARQVMREHGFKTLPSSNRLEQLGRSDLVNAIGSYHGGFYEFRIALGEVPSQSKRGRWKDLNYAIEQARRLMQEHGLATLPGTTELKRLGYHGLINAISSYHGGLHVFRKLLGQDQLQRETGTLKNLDYVIEKIQEALEQHGFRTLPGQKELNRLGYSSLTNAIARYHGGFRKFRQILGEKQLRRPNGVWKNLEYVVEQARAVLQKHNFETLPPEYKLDKLGYGALASAITKYHGGIVCFRQLLAEASGQPSEREKLEGMLRSYVAED